MMRPQSNPGTTNQPLGQFSLRKLILESLLLMGRRRNWKIKQHGTGNSNAFKPRCQFWCTAEDQVLDRGQEISFSLAITKHTIGKFHPNIRAVKPGDAVTAMPKGGRPVAVPGTLSGLTCCTSAVRLCVQVIWWCTSVPPWKATG